MTPPAPARELAMCRPVVAVGFALALCAFGARDAFAQTPAHAPSEQAVRREIRRTILPPVHGVSEEGVRRKIGRTILPPVHGVSEEGVRRKTGRTILPTAEAASEEDQPLRLDRGAAGAAEPESPGGYLFRALLSLGIVIVLIYLAYYGLRILRRPRVPVASGSARIRVLDAARLDADKMLYVVGVGDRTLVLGGAGNQLQLICELDGTGGGGESAEQPAEGADSATEQ
jgi:flagellar biogenesis protein FliO